MLGPEWTGAVNSVDFIPVGVYEPPSILSQSAQEVELGGRKPFGVRSDVLRYDTTQLTLFLHYD